MTASPNPRPLSPHLTIYRWQITSVLSILHRITGIGLSLVAVALALWFAAIAFGGFTLIDSLLNWRPVKLLLILALWAFFFHLCNGIRHLLWDSGRGFDLNMVTFSGYAVAAASLILTLATLLWRWTA
jgi:succinate dehydrogenase / fumarate reductase, cytochrome b subunit